MTPANRKSTGARGIPEPFNRQAGRVRQFKPVVAQLKNGVSAQSLKRPVAPPIYRPRATPNTAQPKMANGAVNRTPPVAPPVYRPQHVPKVLQTKTASAQSLQVGRSPRSPVAPPAYHPEAKKTLQRKAVSQFRESPTATPVSRLERKGIAKPKMAAAPNAHTPPNTRGNMASRVASPGSSITGLRARTIQRTPEESKNLKIVGLMWNKIAEMDPKSKQKVEFFAVVKEIQEKLGFKVYTVWHKHDPYVGGGKNKNYVKIVQALQGDDEGKTSADLYIKWATGDTTIDKLPHELQELLIIVHIAEVGRMYLDAPAKLLSFMEAVSKSGKEERVELWKQFKKWNEYALTAKEDTDYNPNEEKE